MNYGTDNQRLQVKADIFASSRGLDFSENNGKLYLRSYAKNESRERTTDEVIALASKRMKQFGAHGATKLVVEDGRVVVLF